MPSKHANAGVLIRRGLYDNLHSFAELERRISALGDENSKVVGDAFEVFVEGYLATHQKLQAESVWLVGQVPQGIRQQMNLPNDAKGIDGIFRTRTGVLVPYQVKFRSQRAYLTYTQLAPFLGLTERATDRIVFTNSDELAEDVKNRDAMRTVRGIDFDDLTVAELGAISAWLREQPLAITKLVPREYQIEALANISDTLANSDRAHVVMACGTGKTLVALWAAEEMKPKTVLVLVPSLTLLQQTLDEWSRQNSWGNSDRMGNCRVPDKWIENGFRLGQWVAVQRRSRDVTPAEKLQRLDELGFVWDAKGAIWKEGYTHLMVCKSREGDCLVPVLDVVCKLVGIRKDDTVVGSLRYSKKRRDYRVGQISAL